MGSCVGIDLHRQRSVVVVLNEDGERVSWCRIDNTAGNLTAEIVAAGGARIWTVPHRSENLHDSSTCRCRGTGGGFVPLMRTPPG